MNIDTLKEKLLLCYSKDLCYPKVQDNWNDDNKCFGMCAITSLIVNDYFNGKIAKMHNEGVSHYFNILNGKIVDLTSSQFKSIKYDEYKIVNRNDILTEDTLNRYNKLKMKLELNILDEKIHECNLCESLVEKFPNSKTVSIGKNTDILILGEAPANNGWRKSGIAWYDVNNKLLPSGVVLQKLLDELNIKLEETYFLEAIKCFPKERKSLKKCSKNCKKFLLDQIKIINPKLVLCLGDAATKSILDIEYKKYGEVVGKEYKINDITIIPIYHPSPVSPNSYKGNIEIFKNIKNKYNN